MEIALVLWITKPFRGSRSAHPEYARSIKPEEALAILAADPSQTGVFVDFDGTLSPIVDRPQDAALVDGAAEVLEALAGRFKIAGIVSGRSLEDLRARIRARGVLLAGGYGRERSDQQVRRQTEGWETVAFAASAAARNLEGVVLERKGAGIALHFRTAPEQADAVGELADLLAAEYGLEVKPGRKVFELVVPGPGKGDAIASLIDEHRLTRVLVAGDDWGDLEAFGSVRNSDVEAIVIAVTSDEAPPGLEHQADLVLAGPDALVAFLKLLADAAQV